MPVAESPRCRPAATSQVWSIAGSQRSWIEAILPTGLWIEVILRFYGSRPFCPVMDRGHFAPRVLWTKVILLLTHERSRFHARERLPTWLTAINHPVDVKVNKIGRSVNLNKPLTLTNMVNDPLTISVKVNEPQIHHPLTLTNMVNAPLRLTTR